MSANRLTRLKRLRLELKLEQPGGETPAAKAGRKSGGRMGVRLKAQADAQLPSRVKFRKYGPLKIRPE